MSPFHRHLLAFLIGWGAGCLIVIAVLFAITQPHDDPTPAPTGTSWASKCFGDNPPPKGCPGLTGPSGNDR